MAIDQGYLDQQSDIAKVVAHLISGGHTLNGPLIDFWSLSERSGIEKVRLYHALCYLLDGRHGKSFIEEYEGGTLHSTNALARVIGRENETRPWQVYVRLTEPGMLLAKEEIAVQHQFKQLGDFDMSARRSRRAFRLSIGAICFTGAMCIVAIVREVREQSRHSTGLNEGGTPNSQALSYPDTVTMRESVYAICGPCPSDSVP